MDYFNIIKNDIFLDINNKEYLILFNKLEFNINNIYKYVGYNDYNIDYSSTYLIDKNNQKKQLNLLLINADIDKIHIIKNYIIIKKNNKSIIYKHDNNIITSFISNLIDIFRINKIKTNILRYKNNDFYNLFKCKKRYNYFYEI